MAASMTGNRTRIAGASLLTAALMTSLSPYAPHAAATEPAPAPSTIRTVSPASGSNLGGEVITVTGTAFTGTTSVTFGAAPAARFLVSSGTVLTVVAPKLTPGIYPMSVTTAAGTTTAGKYTVRTFQDETLRLVNVARASARKCGSTRYPAAKPLRTSSTLARVATAHSKDMADHNYFSHYSRDGASPFTRIKRAGYRYEWAGENLAAGYFTPAAVVKAWLASSGHCKNIMLRRYTHHGVGVATGGRYGMYWTQDFGTPR